MTKVVGYVRVSTQGQVKDGYSLDYQVDEINNYCAKNNLELVGIYRDEGISGAKVDEEALSIDRDGLQTMLSDLRQFDVRYVVVLNTSRLWRSDIVKVLVHRELKRNEVDVLSIEQPNYSINTVDPNNFLVNSLLEILDQYQRLEIAMKLSRGRHKKAQEGKYAGGGATFGYRAKRSQKVLEIDENKAEIVRQVFTIRANNPDYSLSDIAHVLNIEGYRTTQGKAFGKSQVKRILDHEPFYKGTYCYGGVTAKGQHDAIL